MLTRRHLLGLAAVSIAGRAGWRAAAAQEQSATVTLTITGMT
jgi:hypothetical protein